MVPATIPMVFASVGAETAFFGGPSSILAIATETTPYIYLYKRTGDSFVKLPNPTSLPPNSAYNIAFSPDGIFMAVTHGQSPSFSLYKRNGDTFTKLTAIDYVPTSGGISVSFSPDGDHLAVGIIGNPCLVLYKRNGDSFTKLANPVALPNIVSSVKYSVDGIHLAVASWFGPLFVYKRIGDSYVKLPNPSQPAWGGTSCVAFSGDGKYMTVTSGDSEALPFMTYKVDGDTFTPLASPAILPSYLMYGTAYGT